MLFAPICVCVLPILLLLIGAHHGAYAILCGKIIESKGGKVIAVEPSPVSFGVLQRNIKLNSLEDIVIPINCGVYDSAGKMSINENDVQSQLSMQPKTEGCTVDIVTLESIIHEYGIEKIDLLMIDVEGAELPVLKGFP